MWAEDVDNTTDPVIDERFPNIVPFDPEQDIDGDDNGGCITKTIEEVNPDG